jgi:hypothetical protein
MKRSGLTKLNPRSRAAAAARDHKRAPAKPSRGAAKLEVVSTRRERGAAASGTTSIGLLAGIGNKGEVYIDLPAEQRRAVPARSIVALDKRAIGRELLVAWPRATLQPVVIGLLCVADDLDPEPAPHARRPDYKATIDGEQIELTAEKEITLRCGKASIALTADGKIVIKGAQLLSAASGVHRIRGGAVQIN